ncbi:MAG: cell division protein ZapA [Bacillota bacterium]
MAEVKVDIYHRSYILKGEKSAAQLRKVATEVDYRMKEIAEASPRMDVTRIAVLTALTLAEEYLEIQERYDRVVQMLEDEYRKGNRESHPVIPMKRDEQGEGR